MTRENWKRTTSAKVEKCWKCLKEIWIGDEYYCCWGKRPWCVQCRERSVQEEVDECFGELRKIWDELELKVESGVLNITECQRIYSLKSKIYEVLKTPNKDFGLDYPTVEIDFENLNKSLTDLDSFLKDNASPQIQDRASSNKSRRNKGNKECYHERVEQCTDDPTWYVCDYCWNDDSERFLNSLKWFHQKNINTWTKKHNLNHLRETLAITNKLHETFTTQDQFKQTYQQVVNELNQLARSKGINDLIDLPSKNTNPSTNPQEPFPWKFWVIGGLLIVGLVGIIYLVSKRNKK